MPGELGARVITALFLVAGFLAVLFLLPPVATALVFALVTTLAAWEWAGLIKASQPYRKLFAGLVLLSCLVLWLRPADSFPVLWVMAALFWLGLMPFWLATRRSVGSSGYLVGWVLLVPTWAALVDLHGRSPMLLLAVMALVWIADIAAYFTGRAFGKHKLAPAISPGKTWEGVVGAVLGVMIYGLWVADLLPATADVAPVFMVGALLLLTALSVAGDLFESMIKRQANMKDSSQLLPGHGGILDRIDSQTSTLPVVALALLLVRQ
ncbi:MAG: phosphatidate cytidylyltransferase [Rhodocyclaceae bacterium]|nr:phosphatidate cytidylyltransferase [Rhodocyclaceae bacterium]MDZ4215376.1 phosphatidate cytidylyltransferase [Rhodocyclaceae bacterium]